MSKEGVDDAEELFVARMQSWDRHQVASLSILSFVQLISLL